MTATATKVPLGDILPLRDLYLAEMNVQIRYNACHERGWTDSYLVYADGTAVGYGSVKGREIKDRDTIFEFFVTPAHRRQASKLFAAFAAAARPKYMECQSGDLVLASMLFEWCPDVKADTVLFADHSATEHRVEGAVFRARQEGDPVFEHELEPVGDYVVEIGGEIAGTGGFLLHYNEPFADLYMEVRQRFRRQGVGTLLIQEIKKRCYEAGRVPAARCSIRNEASRVTLLKAGMRISGFMLGGEVRRELQA